MYLQEMAWYILDRFDWLAAFYLELLQAILFIAVQLSAAVFLATCGKYCSRGLPTAIFLVLHGKLPASQKIEG
jgi:hypothetical protein